MPGFNFKVLLYDLGHVTCVFLAFLISNVVTITVPTLKLSKALTTLTYKSRYGAVKVQ